MTDDKTVNINEIYISTPRLMGIPPSEIKLKKEKEFKEKLRTKGKTEFTVCCSKTRDFILGAIELGITYKELNILKETLDGHSLDRFEDNKHIDKEEREIDLDSLIREIFEIATFFKTEEVQLYFINEFYKLVQVQNTHSITLERFNKKWQHNKTG